MVSPRPLSKKAIKKNKHSRVSLTVKAFPFLQPFSEGGWGNRSLGIKERFPQEYLNRNGACGFFCFPSGLVIDIPAALDYHVKGMLMLSRRYAFAGKRTR